MASSTKIRLSPDVEAIAQDIAQKRGLTNVRAAVEAIVRTCANFYLSGDCDCISTPATPQTQALEMSGAEALDDILGQP